MAEICEHLGSGDDSELPSGMVEGSPELKSDCSRCAGLCCVAFSFDKSEDFAFDKAAEEPCLHLDRDFRCTIHDRLGEAGFGGCVAYECFGAGQRVTGELFGGRNWRDEPTIAREMFAAFGMLRKVHELLVLLKTTDKLNLTPEQKTRRAHFWGLLNPENGWTQARLTNFERRELSAEVDAFLKSLRTQGDVLRIDQARSATERRE